MTLKRILTGLAAITCVSVIGFAIPNAVDYFRFRRAISRAEKLTQAELIQIANYCRKVDNHYRFTSDNTPEPFKLLKPICGSLYPGSCDALLYELGDVYLWVRISTSPSNQRICYFTNSTGPQRTKVLWDRNPDFVSQTDPRNRLVTVYQWSMSGNRYWIVLNDRICVVDGSGGRVGSEPAVLATAPFNDHARSEICAAIGGIASPVRGKHYRTAVADGHSLDIRFTPSGDAGSDDISISNTWISAVGPLLDTISKFGPKEYPIDFERIIKRHQDLLEYPIDVRTLADQTTLERRCTKTPWWCVWRSFLH